MLSAEDPGNAFDSIRNMSRGDLRWNVGASTFLPIDRDWDMEIGIQWSHYGFTRVWNDLQYLDSIHPRIGRVEDLSDNGIKVATYDFRMNYLSVPVLFHYDFTGGRRNRQYGGSLFIGPEFHFLMKESQQIHLSGFSVKGEFEHELDATDYDLLGFNASLALGGRYIVRVEKSLFASFQPRFSLQLLNSGSDELLRFNLYQLGLNAGIYYEW